ncbi:dihydrodipicolinate synthase family protein [Oceanobacillus sp. AG]|uniref:dihydrodipicolinate synthase family protein n=1 Tax=Oceanobacillus sp. AG TaxID=2681969 RepID=UPI0012EBA9ED|nr:dihydrodipicolinate synthase family protein [Oceanobacillus sp. AG]
MLNEQFHIAVPTAFLEDESLDLDGTINHIRNLYKQGIKSVLVSGTTGEQHSLNQQEKMELLNRLEEEEELINEMEIIFGVSSVRQKKAEELAERIQETKIAGVMLGFPPYILPTQEEAVSYAKSIMKRSKKPAILYNNPKRTGFDLSVGSILELSKCELVLGIKDAGAKEKVEAIKKHLMRNEFYFYAGGEVDLEEKIAYGYDRLSSIAGNIAPRVINNWFRGLLEGRQEKEQEIKERAMILEQVYQGNAIVNVKKILNQKGSQVGICRSPIGN